MTKAMYVCGIVCFLFFILCMSIFEKIMLDNILVTFVNKKKDGACANEKQRWCNRISSDITLGRNYPTAGYKLNKSRYPINIIEY